MNIQLFGEDPQGATTPEPTPQNPPRDFEKELSDLRAELEKQKNLKDAYAKENAGYKKKELEKMSDDEKRAKEYQDLMTSAEQMKAELEAMKLEKEFFANGFTAEETTKLIKEKSSPSAIAELIKNKVELAVKSAMAEKIKEGTTQQPMGKGTADEGEKSSFQKFQEQQAQNKTKKEIKF